MYFINYSKQLVINCICLSFPLVTYLVYIAYIKSTNKKENKYLLSGAIILSLFLEVIYNKCDNYHIYTLLSAPLLISYISKKKSLSIIISIFLIVYYNLNLQINIFFQILEYSSYLIAYLLLKKSPFFYQIYTMIFMLIRFSAIGIITFFLRKPSHLNEYNITFSFLLILMLLLFSIIIVYLFVRSKKILDINSVLKELDKEKKIKASIFKLNHELKNPLAVCSGYLEMLSSAPDNKKELYLNIINDEIKRSITIINDFSSLGKIKKIEKEELDLAILFEDVKAILNPLYQEKNGKIIIPEEDELYVKADYDRLKQVLINVLKNSLEAKNKSTIDVYVKVKKVKDNYQLIIVDNGKGMTKKELNHIHEMFYTTKQNGSGIGVPYIREIIELHRGSINYKSQYNKGTTVIITLPI